jgi:hypothetical protein
MAVARIQIARIPHLCSRCDEIIEKGKQFYKVGHQEFVHIACFGYAARNSFEDYVHHKVHALELFYGNEDDEPWDL